MLNLRPVRSFVRRQGRMTPQQSVALAALWQQYGIECAQDFNWRAFAAQNPVVLEIGFGMGDSLAQMASTFPNKRFVGGEVHRPGVGALMSKLERQGSTNVRIFQNDVNELLEHMPDAWLDQVYVLFPDPWPKKRHHKRRIIQAEFVQKLARKMKPGGILHLATDWTEYAESMIEVMDAQSEWENIFGQGNKAPLQYQRFETKFERRGVKLGHTITDLAYRRS